MKHLYNQNLMSTDLRWCEAQGLKIGQPKPTQCMTIQQLTALDIVGVYGEDDEPADESQPEVSNVREPINQDGGQSSHLPTVRRTVD